MILNQFRLDDRVALVTGTTRGLGQGIALALAEAGADIVTLGRSTSDDTGIVVKALGAASARSAATCEKPRSRTSKPSSPVQWPRWGAWTSW